MSLGIIFFSILGRGKITKTQYRQIRRLGNHGNFFTDSFIVIALWQGSLLRCNTQLFFMFDIARMDLFSTFSARFSILLGTFCPIRRKKTFRTTNDSSELKFVVKANQILTCRQFPHRECWQIERYIARVRVIA